MIQEYIVKKIAETALENLNSFLNSKGKSLKVSDIDFRKKIGKHLTYVANWSSDVSFKDMRDSKLVNKVYVDLDYYLIPRDARLRRHSEKENKINLDSIFEKNNKHLIILGQPGAGKTTTMKYICQRIIYDENYYPDKFNFPVVIRLRDLNETSNSNLIYHKLFEILGFDIHNEKGITNDYSYSFIKECVLKIADELKLLIILDGFDEIPSNEQKELVIKELTDLCLNIYTSRIIITSRTSDFNYTIEHMVDYEISPLTNRQIKDFTSKYIEDQASQNDLYEKILKSPFADTAMRPLTLAHLCALYENYGDIPEKPKTVYRKTVFLLIENWDAQRSVKRNSKYANFPTERKLDFLYSLAFQLTTWKSKSVFDSHDLMEIYSKLHEKFGLPLNQSLEVVNELETHNGLFIKSGFDQFEFSHKSIQEYLTAEHLIRLGFIPQKIPFFNQLGNELAIAVAISSDQTNYLANIVFNYIFKERVSVDFFNIFLNRLKLEKPDFELNTTLVITMLSIMSKAYEVSRSNAKFGEYKAPHNTISIFDELCEELKFEKRLKEINQNYTISEIESSDPEFANLVINKPIENEFRFSFPNHIEVHASHLQ